MKANGGGKIHDAFFKRNFSIREVAKDFLKHNLPKDLLKQIDLRSVRVESAEFPPSLLQGARKADLIYSAKRKGGQGEVYALIHLEGQSTHCKDMALRIWQYHLLIAAGWLREEKTKTVPIILTYVLYYGKAKWTSCKSIAELFGDNFENYLEWGLRRTFLLNMSEIEKEKLLKQGAAGGISYALHLVPSGSFCENFGSLIPVLRRYDQDTPENLTYMASCDRHDPTHVSKKLYTFDPEKSENMQRYFDKELRRASQIALQEGILQGIEQGRLQGMEKGREEGRLQGIEQGIEKGREQGIEQGIQQVARNLLQRGFTVEQVASACGLAAEAVLPLTNQ